MEFKLATFDIKLDQLGLKKCHKSISLTDTEVSLSNRPFEDSANALVDNYDVINAIELRSKRNGDLLAKDWSRRDLSLPSIIDEAFHEFEDLKAKLHAFCQHFDAKKTAMKSDIELMLKEKLPQVLRSSTEAMDEIKVSIDSMLDGSLNESLEFDFEEDCRKKNKRDSFDSYYGSSEEFDYNKKLKQAFELSIDNKFYNFSRQKPFSAHIT
jgi:hypothetical protein